MVELGTANLDILVVVGTKTTLWSRECLVDCSTCKCLLLMLSSLSKNFLHSHHVLNNYAYWACLLDYPSTISMVISICFCGPNYHHNILGIEFIVFVPNSN